MNARRLWTRVAVVAAVVAVAVVLRFTVFAPDPVAVRVVAAQKGLVEETVTNSRAGTVKARRRAKLAPETGGRVVSLPHRRGSRVRKGDVLLRIEDSLQQGQLEVAEGDVATATAQRDQACLAADRGERERVRIERLAGQGIAAHVVEVAPYVVDRLEQNRTVEIELELDDAAVAASLLPGTSSDAEVILSARDGVLRVPTSSLLEGGKVLVLGHGRLVERALQLGLRNWDFTEVAGGLEEGARVVVSLDRPEIQAGARAREQEGGR
jgi:multidrug efflux pump subunit AcrA (membrane-fusion protein)